MGEMPEISLASADGNETEGAAEVGTKRVQSEAMGGTGGSEERSKRAKQESREDQGVPGHRKFLLTGLAGIKQEVLQGQLDRSGISYNKLWKARKKDAGEVWLKDNEVFLKVSSVEHPFSVLGSGLIAPDPTTAPHNIGLTRAGLQVRAERHEVAWAGAENDSRPSWRRREQCAPCRRESGDEDAVSPGDAPVRLDIRRADRVQATNVGRVSREGDEEAACRCCKRERRRMGAGSCQGPHLPFGADAPFARPDRVPE